MRRLREQSNPLRRIAARLLAGAVVMTALVAAPAFCLAAAGKTAKQTTAAASKADETEEKVNINTATAEQLETLPGIGPALAQRILDHRKQNGPFKKIEELINVRGIGEKSFDRFKDRITVGP